MKKTKRLLCLILTLMFVTSVPTSLTIASAESSVDIGNMIGTVTINDDNEASFPSNISFIGTGEIATVDNVSVLKVSDIPSDATAFTAVKRSWFGESGQQYLISAKIKTVKDGEETNAYFQAGKSTTSGKDVYENSNYLHCYNVSSDTQKAIDSTKWTEIYGIYSVIENDSTKANSGIHIEIRLSSATDVFIKDFKFVETSEVDNLLLGPIDPTFENSDAIYTHTKMRPTIVSGVTYEIKAESDSSNHYVELQSYTDGDDNFYLKNVPVSAGKRYVVAMDVKLPNDAASETTHKASFTGKWFTNTTVTAGEEVTLSNSEWKRVACALTAPADAADKGNVNLRISDMSAGTVLVDNCEVYEIAYDTNNLLNDSNLSFELGVPSGIRYTGSIANCKDGTDGNYCAKITDRTAVGANGTFRFDNISVEAGAIYELSADIKLAEAKNNLTAGVWVDLADGASFAVGETQSDESEYKAVLTDSWTTVKKLFVVNKSNCNVIHFGLRLFGGASEDRKSDIMVDNFAVKKVGTTAALTSVGSNTGVLVKCQNKVAVNITPSEEKDIWMITCAYDEEGRLTETKAILVSDGVSTEGGTLTYTFEDDGAMKNSTLYLWEKDTMQPLCEKIVLNN